MFKLFLLLFLYITNIRTDDPCINYDKVSQLCQECPLGYYRGNGLLTNNFVKFTADCIVKSPIDLIYNKTYYVSNKTCQTTCLGTKTDPFDSLIAAIIYIIDIDLAEKYYIIEISIKLIGGTHYIKPSDLLYDDMKFFRRMNASILISPVFCEDEPNIQGCVSNLNNETIDLIIKTDLFNFEISKNFTIMNINLIGNDIVLFPASQKQCYNTQSICCNSNNLLQNYSNDECGLKYRTLNLSDKSKMLKIKGLFQLKLLYQETASVNALYPTPFPTLNLYNMKISVFHAIKLESGWLSLIMFNPLIFEINLIKVILQDNFFPYGYIYSIKLEDDPYYNYLSSDQIKNLISIYPQSNKYNNTITLISTNIMIYNNYNIQVTSGFLGLFEISIFTFNSQNQNISIYMKDLLIANITLLYPLYFISGLTPATNARIFITFNQTSFHDNYLFLFIYAEYCDILANFLRVHYNVIKINTFLDLISSGSFSVFSSVFSNMTFSTSTSIIFINFLNFKVYYQNTIFMFLNESFSYAKASSLTYSNCTILGIYMSVSTIWTDHIDSSLTLKNVKLFNMTYNVGTSVIFHFFAVSSITINVSDFILVNTAVYRVFQLESYILLTKINFSYLKLINFKGYWGGKYNGSLLLDCNVGSFDTLVIDYLEGIDIEAINLFFMLAYFNDIKFTNIYLANVNYVGYYLIALLPISGAINKDNSVLLYNFTLKNIYFVRYMDNNYVGNFGYLTLNNCKFMNMTYTDSIADQKVRNQIFYLQVLKSFVLNNSYADFLQHTFYIAFFSLYTVDNVTMQNTIFEGKFNNTLKQIPGLNARSFLFFTLINNTILNLSLTKFPLDIADENGVISALASGGYFASNLRSIVTISNNFFYGNIGDKYGILSIVGATMLIMTNNTFIESFSYYGGALAIYSVSSVIISNLIIDSAHGVEGGGMYIYDIGNQLIAENITLTNLIADNNGGGIVLLQVNNAIFLNVECTNLNALQNGGFSSITNSFNISFYNVIGFQISSYSGGFFYIDYCTFQVINVNTTLTHAVLSGGVIFITGSESIVYIQNGIFSESSAESEGAILTSMNIQNLSLMNVDMLYSHVSIGGNGILNFLGFLIGDTNVGIFYLDNIGCRHNYASFGSCLYYSSNNKFILSNFESFNNSGSIFNVESDSVVELVFQKVYFSHSNYYMFEQGVEVIATTSHIIVFINVHAKMVDWVVVNNTAEANFFKISSSVLDISYCDFSNFFNIKSSSQILIRYFSFSNVLVNINNMKVYYNNTPSSVKNCMFFDIRISVINIVDSFFYKNDLLDFSTINVEESTLVFERTEFSYLSGTLGAITTKTTNLTILECLFEGNYNSMGLLDDDSSDINFIDDDISGLSILSIEDSKFKVSCKNSLTIKMAYQVMISRSNFTTLNQYSSSNFIRAIYLQDFLSFYLEYSTFSNFQAALGSVLLFYELGWSSILMEITINSSFFLNNIGNFGAVIYLLGTFDTLIESSIFQNNSAIKSTSSYKLTSDDSGKGACILADCEYYPLFNLTLKNNQFIKNSADKFGPTVLCKSQNKSFCISNINNSFEDNQDMLNFTNQFTGTPIKSRFLSFNFTPNMYPTYFQKYKENKASVFSILNDFQVFSYSIASGQSFNFSIILTDIFDQLLVFESKASGTLTCYFLNESNIANPKQVVFVDKGTTQAYNGILNFVGTKIIFIPNNTLDCQVSILISDSLFFKSDFEIGVNGTIDRSINLNLTLNLRACIEGEILLEDHTCFTCLKGTYLFDNPMNSDASKKCNICPDNAYCKGGNNLSPWKGYWRNSKYSSLIVQCPTSESCLGIGINLLNMMDTSKLSSNELIQGVCHPNYWGNLCFHCKKGYGRAKTNENCIECSSLWVVYVKMFLSMIFIICYIALQAKIFSQIDRKDSNLAILMKLLLNHFQTISLISLVELGWTLDFDFYFSLQNYLSFLTEDFFIIDCMVQNVNQELLVQKIIFTILLPIILSIVMITFWIVTFLILLRKKNKSQNLKIIKFLSQKMRISLLILIFILYPEILRKCFSLLNCLSIDDSYDYTVLSLSPNIQCWAGDHPMWVLTVSLPGLLIWGILSPLLILFILFKYRKKIQIVIFENHSMSMTQRSINKKQTKNIIKRIIIEIDEYIKNKLFGDKESLPKHEIKYKKVNQVFLEVTEIKFKPKSEIMIEKLANPKDIEPSSINDSELININKFIDDPKIFLEYLDFLDKSKEFNFSPNELKEHVVHIKEEYEEKMEESEKRFSMDKFQIEKEKAKQIEDKDRSRTAIVINNLGFIYRGYKPEYYFWEIVMFTRKFMLIFIGVFTEFFPKKTKPTMLIIILVGYMYAQIKFNPYQFSYLNKMESASLAVAFITANIGILLFSDILQNLSILFVLVVFFINFTYFCYWLKYVYEYGQIKDKFKNIIVCWRWLKGKFTGLCKTRKNL